MRALAFLGLIALAGCGNAYWTTYHRQGQLQHGTVISVDARQRFLHASIRGDNKYMQVCAEKSPDVAVAIASALAAQAETPELRALFGASSSEQLANIGLRTQTTQIQAELLYRLCAFNASGQLSDIELGVQLRRFQNTMVAMLAIEQLTGYARPSLIALTSQAAAGAGGEPAQVQEAQRAFNEARTGREAAEKELADARASLAEREAALTEAQRRRDAASSEADKTELANRVADAERTRNEARTRVQTAERQRDERLRTETAARTALEAVRQRVATATGGSATVSPAAQAAATTSKEVAGAVAEIVNTAVNQSFIQETCLQLLVSNRAGNNEDFCREIIRNAQKNIADERIRQDRLYEAYIRAWQTNPARAGNLTPPVRSPPPSVANEDRPIM